MPSIVLRVLLILAALGSVTSGAQAASTESVIRLHQATAMALDSVQVWVDVGSHANVQELSKNEGQFVAASASTRFALSKFDALWVRLRLQRDAGGQAQWSLSLPLPHLDQVVLYQRRGDAWHATQAGDAVAQTQWPQAGLYPEFDLTLPAAGVQEIYLQIRNFRPTGLALRLMPTEVRGLARLRELAALALGLGVLVSLGALSLLRYFEHRKRIDGWACGYGLLIALTVAQINGVLGLWLWADLPSLNNMGNSVIPVLAVGCTVLFMRSVFALQADYRRFDRFLLSVGWGTLASTLSFAVLERFVADQVCDVFMLFASATVLAAAVLSARVSVAAGRWMALGLAPQFAAQCVLLAQSLGWLPLFWEMRYWASLASALAVPAVLYVLSLMTHDRKELVVRANHLPTQDALTGLLTKEIFQAHVDDAVTRAIEAREPVALVLVRVINHTQILQTYGDTTAEQCLLRAVVKLQRVLRDVDPAGRVGTAQFGLLMEGVRTRTAVTERMVKLIASGLIPLPGLVPEVTLHFQVACVLLHENPVSSDRVLDDLRELLANISPNTRRPIRFLEALPTEASTLQPNSTPA